MASRIASTSKAIWPPLSTTLRSPRRCFATEAPDSPSPLLDLVPLAPDAGYIRVKPLPPPKESPRGWLLRREGEGEAAYRWRLAWSGSGHRTPPRPAPDHSSLDLTPKVPWSPHVKRVGAVAKKLGMLTMWDVNGQQMAVTVMRVRLPSLLC